MFEIAWEKYLRMKDPYEKSLPGKDQNHVLDSMRIGRGTFGLKYAYFSNYTAPLMDKLVLKGGSVMELGGEAVADFLFEQKSVAMHTTCYEKSTKVMGLKAANSFWNPRYYNALRPTLTKQLLYVDDFRLLDEVRSLVWLAMTTGRSLVLPNILGPETLTTVDKYRGRAMWPGFRVIFLKRKRGQNQLKVQILEAGYYWRVNRDYDSIPEPTVVYFDDTKDKLTDMRNRIRQLSYSAAPRIVLHNRRITRSADAETMQKQLELDLKLWANDSVGYFSKPYSLLRPQYRKLPSVKDVSRAEELVDEVLQGMRTCINIFGASRGNRSCFQVCD